MPVINGGDDGAAPRAVEPVAPVIPLFGERHDGSRRTPPPEPVWHASWVDDARVDDPSEQSTQERPLPTIGLANARNQRPMSLAERAATAGRPAAGDAGGPYTGRPADAASAASRPTDGSAAGDDVTDEIDPQSLYDAAEALLLRRLRTRQLSVAEARALVTGAGVVDDAGDELLSRFERLGYLDDLALADQLVHAAVERKGQGRQAVAPLLTKRGVPREVVDAVLANLPDDDLERALEFARTKARSLGARDRETALRRLLGQLARRGYPSSVSMAAARQALDEL